MVWGGHWKPHDYPNKSENFQERVLAEVCTDTCCDYKFFILFKENRPSSVLQARYINSRVPGVPSTASTSFCLSAHILGVNGWNLFLDEQVLSFKPTWNTQQDGASTKNFSEPSLCRGRVGNNTIGSFKSWRNCCLERFAAGQPWKQITQLPRTCSDLRDVTVKIFSASCLKTIRFLNKT